ncbi:MAG: PulJ/GspJ family protein [Flavobacteriales bacterium]
MKFNAFTLLELLITSIITGVIGFIVVFFIDDMIITSSHLQTIQKQEEDLALFDMLLEDDLFLTDTFFLDYTNLVLKKDMVDIYYQKEETKINRIVNTDTTKFHLPISGLNIKRMNKKTILEIEYLLASEKVKAFYIDESDYLK